VTSVAATTNQILLSMMHPLCPIGGLGTITGPVDRGEQKSW